MSLGSIVRRMAGPFERILCDWYRAFFINVERCVGQISQHIPENAFVADVGGGDGAIINELLKQRPDVRAAMIDLRDSIGIFIAPENLSRITLYPSTSLAGFVQKSSVRADAVLISDVVHHVPESERAQFMADALQLLVPGGVLIVKDIEPKGYIAFLSKMADRYITGDRHVTLIGSGEMTNLVASRATIESSMNLLSVHEFPNYAIRFKVSGRTLA